MMIPSSSFTFHSTSATFSSWSLTLVVRISSFPNLQHHITKYHLSLPSSHAPPIIHLLYIISFNHHNTLLLSPHCCTTHLSSHPYPSPPHTPRPSPPHTTHLSKCSFIASSCSALSFKSAFQVCSTYNPIIT